ncbi:MAG: phosphate:Na+ symporter [Halanaerobiales bacterium]|nr:phosphate:Na+ symporter [Halanaerobiales bacterium]
MLIFLSGLFLFLLGLEGSKRGLGRVASTKVELALKRLSNSIFLSIFSGVVVTAILQSSSGVSIIVISLIEAGLLQLKPAIGIMLGANIGTTFTVQIISFPVIALFPYLIISGLFFMIIGFMLRNKLVDAGLALASFGVVFAGLNMMTGYFQNPAVSGLITKILAFSGDNYLLGILLGVIITGIIQSSSAVTGITVSLARNNLITLPAAIAIALGSNIGTCITAFLASFNSSRLAKSLARGHFLFNLIGVIAILPFLGIFNHLVMLTSQNLLRQIANAHTLFNIFNILIFLPFFDTFVSFLRPKKL